MNITFKKYTNFESEEFEDVDQYITIVRHQFDIIRKYSAALIALIFSIALISSNWRV